MAESSAPGKSQGLTKILAKLETSIKRGNFYEAHQLYRTLYFRYLRQERYGELLEMLYNGATLLLNHSQEGSGADLAILYVEVLEKSKTKPTEEILTNISNLFSRMSAVLPEREALLYAAIQWSTNNSQNKSGHPRLHELVARTFWKEKNYCGARKHFLLSRDGGGIAAMLVELHRTSGYSTEVDLFIAQVVLQFLCLQNKSTAVLAFEIYTREHPGIPDGGPPFILPLLNFIWFLFKAIDSGKVSIFTILCEEYQVTLKRDPSYTDYLDRIAQIFFGVPPPRANTSRSGFLGNLLESILSGGGGGDDSADDPPPQAPMLD